MADITEAEAERFKFYPAFPNHLRGGVERYIEHGIAPGGFLQAVIRNDLARAVLTADKYSGANLQAIVGWFATEAPAECWGSQEKLDAWLLKHATAQAAAAGSQLLQTTKA